MKSSFDIAGIPIGGGAPFVLFAGPCVLESADLAHEVCAAVKDIAARRGIGYVFKASYDKANRQSHDSFRGPGIEEGLAILDEVRDQHGVPVLTDVHSPDEAIRAGKVVDVVQVPAYLGRQTDLVMACGHTGKPVLVKKGQFLPPQRMKSVIEKVEAGGSDRIMLCERGAVFGYGDLVVDMRSLYIMKKLGAPVVYDAVHSVQRLLPNKETSGGVREYIEPLARAAVACGVDGVFIETHPDCDSARCDAATMLPLDKLEGLLTTLIDLDRLVKEQARA